MPKNARFWRNVVLIGVAHAILITGLVRWSRESRNPTGQSVVWMNGGVGDGAAAPVKKLPPPNPRKISTQPTPEPEVKNEPEQDRPVLTSARSDIQLPAATPTPSPRLTPKPSSTPKVKVTPKPKPTTKPKPKPTPKPSPKKMVVAKASPKPKPTPQETNEKEGDDVDLAEKKKLAKEALEKNGEVDSLPKPPKAVAAQSGSSKGTSGNGGHGGGSGGESQFGWYGSMLHDRFYSEWVQPTTVASSGEKFSVLVKLRIEKDGRVSHFEIIKPSGNTAVDESVTAVAKRVTQVDPLPVGLGNGEHYDVKINFELNSDQ
ncbi:MAG TPA: TonB family protein [Chthoniobacterales bacterium]|jgi:TonB family protein|nr:TonB family protein [Chthoniobacterales bacterium]